MRLLRRDGVRLADIRPGFTPKFTIYDEDDQLALIKSIFKAAGLDEKFMQYRAVCSWISHQKSHKQSPEDVYEASTDDRTARLASIYKQYEERLRQANALDFDDLLLESVRLLAHDEDLRRQYNRRFEFVMIDEYQDTNRSQYELMRLLTEARKNVAVVGDEDQSIYGWRGADIRNILDFERDYPNATVIRLEQNYRSTKNILEAASAVVANNDRAQRQVAVDGGRRGRTHRPVRGFRRRAGSVIHRRYHRAPACRRIRASAWRCCIAPISSPGRLKKHCGAIAANMSWWAA